MKVIRSSDNPLYRSLCKLAASARERRAAGRTLLDGDHLVRAYADAGLGEAEAIAVAESALGRPALRALFETLPARTRMVLADRLLERLSQVATSPGLVAMIETPRTGPMPASIGDAVFLEGIQDPGNLGSILRTAQAAGVKDVLLSPGTAAAWSPKVVRAGMGAHFRLAIHENVAVADMRARLEGCAVAAAARGRTLYDLDLRGPVAWMFGSEGGGLSEAALAQASDTIGIPMPGGAESLNVGAAVAVCLFEQVRQRCLS